MDGNTRIAGIFERNVEYTMAYNWECGTNMPYAPGGAYGRVKAEPEDVYTFQPGQICTLTAQEPDPRLYAFYHWECAGNVRALTPPYNILTNTFTANGCSHSTLKVVMNGDYKIRAVYGPRQYPLNIQINPQGRGTVTASYEPPTSTGYYAGTSVTLTAEPDEGWRFIGWTGDVDNPADPTDEELTLCMSQARTVTAVFERLALVCCAGHSNSDSACDANLLSYAVGVLDILQDTKGKVFSATDRKPYIARQEFLDYVSKADTIVYFGHGSFLKPVVGQNVPPLTYWPWVMTYPDCTKVAWNIWNPSALNPWYAPPSDHISFLCAAFGSACDSSLWITPYDVLAARGDHTLTYVQLNCCYAGRRAEQWRAAFGAKTLVAWDSSIPISIYSKFNQEFWPKVLGGESVATAATDAWEWCLKQQFYDDWTDPPGPIPGFTYEDWFDERVDPKVYGASGEPKANIVIVGDPDPFGN